MAVNSGGSMWAWANVKTISILTIGVIMLLVFIIIEAFFARIPIIPLRLFKQRSPAVLILTGQVAELTNFHLGLVALQANSADEDRAVATGTRNVFRSLGGVVGIAVSTAAYYAVLERALHQSHIIPGWLRGRILDGTWAAGDANTKGFEGAILDARMQGFRVIFIMTVPLMALCLLASFMVDDIILKGDRGQFHIRERDQGSKQTTTGMAPSEIKRDESQQTPKGQ
ncbi:hypothetical protein IL306_009793 [Fusarium sp. DS 682]|nr:hypothetical protein IL306_009793 [Fusarium sp. DS 682]